MTASYTATWSAGAAITYDLAGGAATGANPGDLPPGRRRHRAGQPDPRRLHVHRLDRHRPRRADALPWTIPSGSTGPRSYTTTWTLDPAAIEGVTGDGTSTSPYLVGTAADLDAVAAAVNGDSADAATACATSVAHRPREVTAARHLSRPSVSSPASSTARRARDQPT